MSWKNHFTDIFSLLPDYSDRKYGRHVPDRSGMKEKILKQMKKMSSSWHEDYLARATQVLTVCRSSDADDAPDAAASLGIIIDQMSSMVSTMDRALSGPFNELRLHQERIEEFLAELEPVADLAYNLSRKLFSVKAHDSALPSYAHQLLQYYGEIESFLLAGQIGSLVRQLREAVEYSGEV